MGVGRVRIGRVNRKSTFLACDQGVTAFQDLGFLSFLHPMQRHQSEV